jgi:hypothetical protein
MHSSSNSSSTQGKNLAVYITAESDRIDNRKKKDRSGGRERERERGRKVLGRKQRGQAQ